MKKMIFTAAMLSGCALFAQANLNFAFNAPAGRTVPNGWGQNNAAFLQPLGKCKLVAGSKAGTKALEIEGGKGKNGVHLYGARIKAKGGDTVAITVDAKGSGSAVLGFYSYGAKSFVSMQLENVKVSATDKFSKISISIKVADPAQKGNELAFICPVIGAAQNSTVTLENLKIEVKPAAAKK